MLSDEEYGARQVVKSKYPPSLSLRRLVVFAVDEQMKNKQKNTAGQGRNAVVQSQYRAADRRASPKANAGEARGNGGREGQENGGCG